MAKDPICDMEVDEQTAEFKSQYGGQTYYFAQKNAKNNLKPGPSSMHVSRKKTVSSLRVAVGLAAYGIRVVTGSGICCIVHLARL